ncbi:MAG: protein kinase [Chloroflexota bacterium]|nr:serine/threonine protein kinase [Dehalococcoidia bacterium]MDW8252861.1 protein kinase [Chloroflexota bacterium]
MDPLIGRSLGQYQIVELLGSGGMATVYRALQPALNRSVAIKVLPPVLANDDLFVARFRREAMVVAGLAHPNILPVYDFGIFDGYLAIIMMYVRGGTLRTRLGEPMPVATAVQIAAQVADALRYAHERGIVHRDVKPSNILMARSDWALLADFGIAQLADQRTLTLTGAKVGTPEYMSPEQAAGDPVDARSDLYSLGIVLYEMLTGRVPFSAPTTLATLQQQIHTPLPPITTFRRDLPPGLIEVVKRALEKSPAARFATAAEFHDALLASLEPAPVEATVVPVEQRAPPPPAIGTPPASPRQTTWLPMALGGVAIGAVLAVLCGGLALAAASGMAGRVLPIALSTPVARPSETPTPAPIGGVLYQADFSSPARAQWALGDGSEATIEGGRLFVTSLQANRAFRVWPERAPLVEDFILEAEITKLTGPNNFGYGVTFRDDGKGSYFFFSITGNGSFKLEKWVAASGEWVTYVNWTSSNAINRGDNVPNVLRVIATGSQIKLLINDRPVATATDDAPVRGNTGILVGTTGLRVAVSSFQILQP